MKLSPAWIGFIKALGVVIVYAVVAFATDATHLNSVLGPAAAAIVAGLAASLESYLKSQSQNTTALFGAIKIKRSF